MQSTESRQHRAHIDVRLLINKLYWKFWVRIDFPVIHLITYAASLQAVSHTDLNNKVLF